MILNNNIKRCAVSQIGFDKNNDYFGFLKYKKKKKYFIDNDIENQEIEYICNPIIQLKGDLESVPDS